MKSGINGFLIDSKNHEPRDWGGYKPAEKSTRAKIQNRLDNSFAIQNKTLGPDPERKGTPVGINCCLTMQQIDELVTWFTPRCRVCRQGTRPGWPVGDD